ncbi:MAG TPA: DnaB-like helicase C-terminal domain-containing protein, partial [Holophaga sp.]|nr:DnaB-like helicase C-terminal domain-containing protein [Holophaga sp.]
MLAQVESPSAPDLLQECDPTAFSGHIVRTSLMTLQDLVCTRGLGLSRQEAVTRLMRLHAENDDACQWLSALDLASGARANLDKLAGQVERLHASQEAQALLAAAKVSPDTLDDDLGGIMSRLSELLTRTSDDRFRIESLEPYLRAYANGEPVIPPDQAASALCWGVQELDDSEEGIVASPGTFGVVAAPPGFGKSIAVSQITVESALAMGKHVLLVSLEQNRPQVAMRSIASLRRDFKSSVRKGHSTTRLVTDAEWDASRHVWIMAPGSGTQWFRIEGAARRLHRAGKLDVLILDYFTLLEPPQIGRQATSAAQYGWISKAGKRLAQELMIPVVFVAQFSRAQGTWDQEPEMKDLKETGQLEQDADWLFFMWAPPKKADLQPVLDAENRVVCYKKAKNRWGKMDFSGNPRYLEVDPARDRLNSYTRSTDGTAPQAAEAGGHVDRF